MKKIIFFLLTLPCIYSAAAQNGNSRIPENVKENFSKDFPDTRAIWCKEAYNYAAIFINKDTQLAETVVYSPEGICLKSELEMDHGYPAAIDEYLRNYPNEKHSIWMTYDRNGSAVYYSTCSGQVIWFDENGNYCPTGLLSMK